MKTISHPRLGEITVCRSRQARRISVSVRPPGKVRLTLPALCPLRNGLAFVEQKAGWIEDIIRGMKEKYPERLIVPPYRTAAHELVFKPSETDKATTRVGYGKITVTYPAGMSLGSEEIQRTVRTGILRAYKKEAAAILPQMTERLAREHGFRYGKVTIRPTRSRWGSCSGRDDISLSAYLMMLPQHLIEYIILHELCHTRHKNHSPEFHALLDSHLGGREKRYIKEIRKFRPGIF